MSTPNWAKAHLEWSAERKKYANYNIIDEDIISIDRKVPVEAGDIITVSNFDDFDDGKYKVIENKNNIIKLGMVERLDK